MKGLKLTVEESENSEDLKVLENGISDFNGPELSSHRRAINIIMRNSNDEITSGLSASTNWGWLYVRLLWVSNENRGQGIGTQLMLAAEDEARKRNCHGAWIDTFNVQTRHFYEKLGYVLFGELNEFPRGHQRYFLFKKLDN